MGRTYLFDCPKCGYQAKISGGIDVGCDRIVQTIECRDCHELRDVTIRLRAAEVDLRGLSKKLGTKPATTIAGSGDPVLLSDLTNKLLTTALSQIKWKVVKPVCPESKHHRIRPWKSPGKCPRCGTFLEWALKPYRIWD